MRDSEVITILVLFHLGCFRNFKHFYKFYVQEHLKSDFPDTISYNRFLELSQKVCMPMTLFLKTCCLGQSTGYHLLILHQYAFVKTNEFIEIKYSKVLQRLGNRQWVGFMYLNFI